MVCLSFDYSNNSWCRVGRTARLGEKGDSLLFLQPVEVDYLHDLEKHGVSLTEYPILKVLGSFPLYGQVYRARKFVSLDLHPWVLYLQRALESFILSEVWLSNIMLFCFELYCLQSLILIFFFGDAGRHLLSAL
jgi:ATP-dependent RNA helicase DDX31/DBP7